MRKEEIKAFKERADAFLDTARYNFHVFKQKEVEQFIKNEMESLTKMADIYITSRYYTREFYEEEIENLFSFASKIKELLGD